ncbi:MAG: 2TM domain-containing protein [Acidimicrobiia bacterium]|nr:2TM domain-containing protein [Acidimicrobiia bacterium]NNC75308.1 2TM domain-containing protein [Acidimicrobiia bacterium]
MESTPEARARKRAKAYYGLMWHIGTFVVVNAFLWFIDINGGNGLDWAYWTTIPWGVALGFHTLSYFIDSSGMTERKYEKFLETEKQRAPQDH